VGAGHVTGLDVRRRRSTAVIFAHVSLGSTSLFAAFTVAPLVASELTRSRVWSGLPGAFAVAGTALGASLITVVMVRKGRAPGLRLGYAIGVLGGAGALLAVAVEVFPLLLAAMVLIGIGHGSNQLARFTAADLHSPEARSTVLSWIVWASTVGAVLGPLLPRRLRSVATSWDLPPEAAGFLVSVAFFAAAAALTGLLRPDPSVLAIEEDTAEGLRQAAPVRIMAKVPRIQAALVALLAAQTAMVLVMTLTPLEIRDHGHGLGVVGLVMSAHFVGMFALAPVAGRAVARAGSSPVILFGLFVLVCGAVGAGLTSGDHSLPMGLWLFMLGLGWSAAFVASSAMLTHGLAYQARVRVQGAVDTLAWTASAVASAFSGLVLDRLGYLPLALTGAAIACVPIALLARRGPMAEAAAEPA
jgi:MFS family permease